jgi:hypothetical protein
VKSLNDVHVLASRSGGAKLGWTETYWTGKLTSTGAASTSVHLEHARVFKNPRDAYDAGALLDGLKYFRAIRPMYRKHYDGFRTRWWMGE